MRNLWRATMRPRHVLVVGMVMSALLAWQVQTASQAPAFDLVIRGGRVIDGTGNPWFLADVGIKGDSIAAVAPNLDSAGAHIVEAQGRGLPRLHRRPFARRCRPSLEPLGTVDPLVRDDRQDLIGNPAAENNVRQGVTTVFAGPDGFGAPQWAPISRRSPRRSQRSTSAPSSAMARFAPRSWARRIGQRTPEELQRMRDLVRTGMREGAFGLSTGLFYVPGTTRRSRK